MESVQVLPASIVQVQAVLLAHGTTCSLCMIARTTKNMILRAVSSDLLCLGRGRSG